MDFVGKQNIYFNTFLSEYDSIMFSNFPIKQFCRKLTIEGSKITVLGPHRLATSHFVFNWTDLATNHTDDKFRLVFSE